MKNIFWLIFVALLGGSQLQAQNDLHKVNEAFSYDTYCAGVDSAKIFMEECEPPKFVERQKVIGDSAYLAFEVYYVLELDFGKVGDVNPMLQEVHFLITAEERKRIRHAWETANWDQEENVLPFTFYCFITDFGTPDEIARFTYFVKPNAY